jgi:hypothetical protein
MQTVFMMHTMLCQSANYTTTAATAAAGSDITTAAAADGTTEHDPQ